MSGPVRRRAFGIAISWVGDMPWYSARDSRDMLIVSGRQEPWEDSPAGWPQEFDRFVWVNGRPIAQWPRIDAGRSDDISVGS